jgi:predicted SAM-dependent methyltransferase
MTPAGPSKQYAAHSRLTRLNWGCGAHVAAGWINSDVKDEPGVDLVADIRKGLPLQADAVDYAVSVHALPELPYPELVPALSELRRVLKPDGVLRLVLPDLDRGIDAYRRGDADYFKVPREDVRSASGRFIVHTLWYGYSRSLFTREFAEELLANAGFERVRACSYRRTSGPFGRIVELDNRPEESLYLEARKPRPTSGPHGHLPYTFGVADDDLEIVDVAHDPGTGVKAHFTVHKGDGRKVTIVGWALGDDVPVTEVEVLADGSIAGRTPITLERPDVAEHYPDASGAATSGFQLELIAGGRGESQLELFAVLNDESREPLGRILVKAERRSLLGALRRG